MLIGNAATIIIIKICFLQQFDIAASVIIEFEQAFVSKKIAIVAISPPFFLKNEFFFYR